MKISVHLLRSPWLITMSYRPRAIIWIRWVMDLPCYSIYYLVIVRFHGGKKDCYEKLSESQNPWKLQCWESRLAISLNYFTTYMGHRHKCIHVVWPFSYVWVKNVVPTMKLLLLGREKHLWWFSFWPVIGVKNKKSKVNDARGNAVCSLHCWII